MGPLLILLGAAAIGAGLQVATTALDKKNSIVSGLDEDAAGAMRFIARKKGGYRLDRGRPGTPTERKALGLPVGRQTPTTPGVAPSPTMPPGMIPLTSPTSSTTPRGWAPGLPTTRATGDRGRIGYSWQRKALGLPVGRQTSTAPTATAAPVYPAYSPPAPVYPAYSPPSPTERSALSPTEMTAGMVYLGQVDMDAMHDDDVGSLAAEVAATPQLRRFERKGKVFRASAKVVTPFGQLPPGYGH